MLFGLRRKPWGYPEPWKINIKPIGKTSSYMGHLYHDSATLTEGYTNNGVEFTNYNQKLDCDYQLVISCWDGPNPDWPLHTGMTCDASRVNRPPCLANSWMLWKHGDTTGLIEACDRVSSSMAVEMDEHGLPEHRWRCLNREIFHCRAGLGSRHSNRARHSRWIIRWVVGDSDDNYD